MPDAHCVGGASSRLSWGHAGGVPSNVESENLVSVGAEQYPIAPAKSYPKIKLNIGHPKRNCRSLDNRAPGSHNSLVHYLPHFCVDDY
jgi:hypothetical protein